MDGVPATNNPLLEIRTPVSSGEFCKTTAPVPVEDALMAIVPDVVIGDPVTVINEGTVTATEVTVPPPESKVGSHVLKFINITLTTVLG